MGKINAKWHSKNKMPKNPSLDQRLVWHAQHFKNYDCRKPTRKILEELKNEN
jgi:hypothetical protein